MSSRGSSVKKSAKKTARGGNLDRKLGRLTGKFLRLLRVGGVSLEVIVLPHRKIAAIKRRFTKKHGEPNVLSFSEPPRFPHPETKKRPLGEIYLNRDILKRDPGRAAPLLLHGILHLLGYDHKKRIDAAKMERIERNALRKVRV